MWWAIGGGIIGLVWLGMIGFVIYRLVLASRADDREDERWL